ncbi:MAG: Protein of unknown function DUF1804 [Magnetococcales bacterium]|nr:Protein of unknown function DUF1804 [Magnetococcales bacterium]
MAHSTTTRQRLRTAFINGTSLDEAAAQVDAPISTARRWKSLAKKDGDDWERVRAASQMSGAGRDELVRDILAQFLLSHQTAMKELSAASIPAEDRVRLLASLSDAFNKTMSSLAKTSSNMDRLGVANEVLTLLAYFVANHFPGHGAALVEIMEPFGAELARHYNG